MFNEPRENHIPGGGAADRTLQTLRKILLYGLLASLGVPAVAWAQAAETRVNVVAMDADNPTKILVRFQDMNQGTAIQIREVPTNDIKRGWFVENRNDEHSRIRRLTRRQFPVTVEPNQQEPRGRFTVMGAPDQQGKNYQILVLRNGRVGVVGEVPLKQEGEGTVQKTAVAMLKEVVWAPNGKLIIVVVNQTIERDDGIENVDEVYFFRFRQWKVKWMQPTDPAAEDGGGGQGQ